jgi:hypothetical protein
MEMKNKIYFTTCLIFVIGLYAYLRVRKQDNIKAEIYTKCTNDTIVNLRNGNLSLHFNNIYEKIAKNKMIIQIIRKGKVFEKLNHIKKNDNIEIELKKYQLYTTDSLKITFDNNKSIYIHGFENEIEYAYGEQHIIGCFLLYYNVDNHVKQTIHDGFKIDIL